MTDPTLAGALTAELGPAPLVVTSANRGMVRKWCRAKGIASRVVEKLTNAQLAEAYNDLRALYTLTIIQPEPRPRPSATINIDPELLADMVNNAVSEALAARPMPMTEERVRELIREQLSSKSRVK